MFSVSFDVQIPRKDSLIVIAEDMLMPKGTVIRK
jgi:hypothetical protein